MEQRLHERAVRLLDPDSLVAGRFLPVPLSVPWNPYVLIFFMLGLMLPMKPAILPLMKPSLATGGIVHLIGVWNDFFDPLIFLKSEELSTIPLGVRQPDPFLPADDRGVPVFVQTVY
jgi:hypothetical protein